MASLQLQPGMPLDLSAVLAQAKGQLNVNYGQTPSVGSSAPTYGGGGLIQNAIASAQAAQKKANLANEARYQQGLAGLTAGQTASRGLIQQSLSDLDTSGTAARQRIASNTAANLGQVQTSAAARGIGNFTVVDSLNRGVNKDAENANQAVDESVARQKSAIRLAQANNENGTAGSIAQFIANRNDLGPNQSNLASLIQGAAAGVPAGQRSGSITHNSLPGYASGSIPQITGGSGYNQSSGIGGYFTGNGTAPAYTASQGNYVATQGTPQMTDVSTTPTTNLGWDGNSLIQQAVAAQKPAAAPADPLAGVDAIGPGMLSAAMDKGFKPPSWTETSGLNADAAKELLKTRYRQWIAQGGGK